MRLPPNATRAPSSSSTRAKVCVSRSRGTLRSRCTPGASSVAAMIGSAAFFAPEMRTSPSSGWPPVITSLSTLPLFGCERLHRERVDLRAHAVAERRVDELVALHAALAGEGGGNDERLKMLAVAAHFEMLAGEAGLDAAFDAVRRDHVSSVGEGSRYCLSL